MSSANRTITIDPERAAESNVPLLLIIFCVVWSLAFVTALTRFYTRAILVRSFGKDDVFMVLAVLCGIGGLVTWIIECKNGFGRHQDTIPPSHFGKLLEAQFFQSVVEASFAFGFLKISIALSLLRLSTGNWYRWICWSLIAFTCFYTLFAFVTFLTYCRPIAGQWTPSLRPRCYDRVLYRDFGLFNTACNIFTDVSFATLPIPLIWSLQLQRRSRLYLIAILSGGYFAVGLGITKAIYIIAYVQQRDGTFFPGAPFFGSLQLDIGIIAACAPTLRPLLGRVLGLSSSLDPYRGANYYRAGKALDRLPVTNHSGPGRGHQNCHVTSGEFVELEKGEKQWAVTNMKLGESMLAGTAFHAEDVARRGGKERGKESSDEDAISPVSGSPQLKGIVKTTEVRVRS